MNISNELGLPQAIVNALTSDYKYKDKQFSATTILQGIKSFILMKRHSDEITMDANDGINLVFGTAVHSIFENSKQAESELAEEYMKVQVPTTDYYVSGRLDLYNIETKELTDYKTCTIWKIKFKDFEEWERQLLIYAWMLKKLDMPIEKTRIVALIKDYSKKDYRLSQITGDYYPPSPIIQINFEVTDEKLIEIEKWIIERFKNIAAYEQMADDDIPSCSEEERWNSGSKWAVMPKKKDGTISAKAFRVLDTEQDARTFISLQDDPTRYVIQKRLGEDRKCQDYCNACSFCKHYQKLMEETNGN